MVLRFSLILVAMALFGARSAGAQQVTKQDVPGAMNFTRLKALLAETDGNLGAQLRKLEDAKYIAADKKFQDRKPITWYALTARGATALKRHLRGIEQLTKAARMEKPVV